MHAYEVNMHHLPLLKIECGVMTLFSPAGSLCFRATLIVLVLPIIPLTFVCLLR